MVFVLRSSPNHASSKYTRCLTEKNIKITLTYDNSYCSDTYDIFAYDKHFQRWKKKEDFDVATGMVGVAWILSWSKSKCNPETSITRTRGPPMLAFEGEHFEREIIMQKLCSELLYSLKLYSFYFIWHKNDFNILEQELTTNPFKHNILPEYVPPQMDMFTCMLANL
jgi:hypothetical protein